MDLRTLGVALLLAVAGCPSSKEESSSDLIQPPTALSGGTTEAPVSSTTGGLSGTGYVDDTSSSTSVGSGEGATPSTGLGASTGPGGLDLGSPVGCGAIDVDGCYSDVLETCGYPASQACIELIESCYGSVRPPAIVAETLHDLCGAELEGFCLDAPHEGCGQTYCECIAGDSPFDWDNCFHLTLAGCYDFLLATEPECDAALALCYPSGTQAQWNECFDQLSRSGLQCDCALCGPPDQCEALLSECMGQR